MDTKAIDDTFQFVSDTAAEIVKIKDAGGWDLTMIADLLSLAPEALDVVNESGDFVPELKGLDQATAVAELGKAYIAIRALIDAILYKPAKP